MRTHFKWDEDGDIYNSEKYSYNGSDYLRDELEEIVSIIRKEITNKRIFVTVNNYMQLVVRLNLNNIEKLNNFSEGMDDINDIEIKYLSDFNCYCEMSVIKDVTTLYCYYDKF